MATHVITVNGTPRKARLQTPVIEAVAQDTHTLTADFISTDASFRPAKFQTITWTENGTPIFGGVILKATEIKLGDKSWTGIVTRIEASDFNHYATRRVVFDDFPSQTLKARLTSLVSTYLSVFGTTLHASQVTGPTIPARSYATGTKLIEVLDETVALASTPNGSDDYLWRIDYSNVLRAIVLGSESAPFNITDNDGNVSGAGSDDLTVDDGATDSYANVIYATGGVVQQDVRTEHFTGDGTTVTFTPTWQILNTYGYLTVDGVGEGISPIVNTAVWYYDSAANSLTDQGGTPPFDYVQGYRTFPAAVGADIQFIFKGQSYPVESATDSGGVSSYGPWEDVIHPQNVGDDSSTLQDFADAELSKRKDLPRTIQYKTRSLGLFVGQTQTVTNTKRNISGLSCTITGIETRNDAKDLIIRTVTLTESTKVRKDYHELLDRWLGAGDNAAPQASTEPSTDAAIGAAPPDHAVQYDQAGAFAGSEFALLDPLRNGDTYGPFTDEATLAVGVNSGTAIVQAWFNKTAGKALAAWTEVDNLGRFNVNGAGPNTRFIGQSEVDISAGTNIAFAVGGTSNFALMPNLFDVAAVCAGMRRITANYTLDTGAVDLAIWHDSASNHTLSLPALSGATVISSVVYQRMLFVKNGSAGGTLTIDPNSTETIEGASTLVLGPNASTILIAKSGTGADWKVFAGSGAGIGTGGSGPASAAGSDGDVQYDSGGFLAAESNFNYDAAGNRLHLTTDHTDYGQGVVLAVYGSPGDVTPASGLTFIDLEPGTDAAVTAPVGVNIQGIYSYPVLTTAASGTHSLLALNSFDTGGITSGGATISVAATVWIGGPPGSGSLANENYALYIASGTGAIPFLISDTIQMSEISAPSAPAANQVRIYAEDNGSGKTRLMAKFNTGAAQQIAIEP